MSFRHLLIANRGEIAIRIARAAAELGLATTAVFSADDALSLHTRAADAAVALEGMGAAAYLNINALIAIAKARGCDAIHPGYGFLSENPAFALACDQAGIAFIGAAPETLAVFGDKSRARSLAASLGVPVLAGTEGPADLEAITAFFDGLPAGTAMMIKAVAGGGGRGMRLIHQRDEVAGAFAAAGREAQAAFGDGRLYAERALIGARHIEVQAAGDGKAVVAVGERDCSLQRRRQKILEIAPAPRLDAGLRETLFEAATTLARATRLRGLATFEFLVIQDSSPSEDPFVFIEANPRLQVEHTVTEAVTGVDLVQAQIRLAAGDTLAAVGLGATPASRGAALQARVNLETLGPGGQPHPSGGRLAAYEPPSGPGIRVDGYGYAGYETNPNFDSLLAKVIAHAATFAQAAGRLERALAEFRIEGVETNIGLLRALLSRPEPATGAADTGFVEANAQALAHLPSGPLRVVKRAAQPLDEAAAGRPPDRVVDGALAMRASLQATVGAIEVSEGDLVRPGQTLAILEAMKMEHVVAAQSAGRVLEIAVARGEVVQAGQALLFIAPEAMDEADADQAMDLDIDAIRPDLAEVNERWRILGDAARPEAVARRRARNQRTARENIEDLIDPGSFQEYGAFAVAAQRRRRTAEELLKISPADGLICGIGSVNGALYPPERARCAALAYDFTVLAGTQGHMNHLKTDRLLEIVEREELPVVWFVEGGGGRPGDTDGIGASGLATPSFRAFAQLAGRVPKIAVVSGRCFAGNAAFAGLSEILIATKGANLGMGGPAMIEGGGLGQFAPEDIGPMATQTANGVVDILAEDEADATRLAKQALSYFQGPVGGWSAADQRALRHAIPENRLRVYDPRPLIEALVDQGSFLELRPAYAPGMIVGLIRVEGRPMGLIANDPRQLGGAVDCDGADKASRLFQLADAYDLPVLSLIDTPGFMVGPDSEAAAAVRKTSRLFINAARLGTPLFAVVLRKAYGLGAQAMAGGSTLAPMFSVAWPTGEFGGMGLEGSVRLGYRRELEAETDPAARTALFERLLGSLYRRGKAANVAATLEIDAVIDPSDTRSWIAQGLKTCKPRHSPPRRFVDAW